MDTRFNKSKEICIERVIRMRQEKGWTQEQFSEELSKYSEKKLTQAAISMWECRNRKIPLKYLSLLRDVLGVSEDYLLGITNKKNPSDTEIEESSDSYSDRYELQYWQLYAYDRKPLFLDFSENHEHEDGWAIYNRQRGIFIFADDIVKEATIQRIGAKIYTMDLNCMQDPFVQRKAITADKILSVPKCYVEMISTDRYIKGLYNGWYKPVIDPKDKNNGVLINNDGLILPISGLKKSFYAYTYSSIKNAN